MMCNRVSEMFCLYAGAPDVHGGHPFIVEAAVSIGGKGVKEVRDFSHPSAFPRNEWDFGHKTLFLSGKASQCFSRASRRASPCSASQIAFRSFSSQARMSFPRWQSR